LKKIIFYISDHGKGHATRSIAIIRQLQKLDLEIIVRNSNSINLIKKSLPKIKIISGITDVGSTIRKDGVSIDSELTTKNITKWIKEIPKLVKKESNMFQQLNPDLIISDISIMPFHVAKKFQIQSIAISNFTWSDVIKTTPENIKFLDNSYEMADLAIQLPFCTQMKQFANKKSVGIVARESTLKKYEFRKIFNINNKEKCIFFSLGNSEENLQCNIGSNVKVLTNGVKIRNNYSINVSKYTEQQNLVSCADLVICKCGYGLISECVVSGTPFLYVYDPNHLEQMAIVNTLRRQGFGKGISLIELNRLCIDDKFIASIKKFSKQPIKTKQATKYIQEFL
jgi:uncharacterized protein (TIGR00661 family)